MAKKVAKRKTAAAARKRSSRQPKRKASNRRATSTARSSARTRPRRAKTATKSKRSRKKTAAKPKKRSLQSLRNAGARAKRRAAAAASNAGPARKRKKAAPGRASARPRAGGTGRERDLSQTPETGRSVKGLTNPFPTKRSTGTGAGAGNTRRVPGLERARRQLREVEESVPGPPSSLNMDRRPSAARSGRHELREARLEHNEVSPEITAGDVDANWEEAYSVGDEAPGGDNPTPDQDRVDDIGKALGVEYEDNEELKASDKIAERDRKRWELDPASSDDYRERD